MSLAETQSAYDEASVWFDAANRKGGLRRKIRFRIIENPMRKLLAAGGCLDLGCGTGRLLREVPSAAPNVGMDLSLGMLRSCDLRAASVCAADAHKLPFADASFSSIISTNGVFCYLEQDEAFSECYRVLKPGGKLAVHQYAQRCSTIRRTKGPVRPINSAHLANFSQLTAPAERAGLRIKTGWLWRSLRVFPFALPIPTNLPGNHWGHAVALFEKPTREPLQ